MSVQYTLYLHVPSVHPVSTCPFSTPCIYMSLQYTLYLHVSSVHPVSACPFSTPCIYMSLQYTLYLHVPSVHPVSTCPLKLQLRSPHHRSINLQSTTIAYRLDVPIKFLPHFFISNALLFLTSFDTSSTSLRTTVLGPTVTKKGLMTSVVLKSVIQI